MTVFRFNEVELPEPSSMGQHVALGAAGLPLIGLVGYWDAMGGTIGEPHPGPYRDVSGRKNHGILRTNYAPPTQISTGLRISSPYGLKVDVPLAAANETFTAIVTATPKVTTEVTGARTNYLEATVNSNDTIVDNPNPGGPYPVVQFEDNLLDIGEWVVANTAGGIFGSTYVRYDGSRNVNEPNVYVVAVDGLNETAYVTGTGGTATIVNGAGIRAFFDGVSDYGTFVIGAWPHSSTPPVDDPYVDWHGTAIYNRFVPLEVGQKIADTFGRTLLEQRLINF